MSTPMINPVADLAPVSDLGGFDTRYVYPNRTNTVAGRALLIGEDRKICVVTGAGIKRTYRAGLLASNVLHPIETQQICSNNTEVAINDIFIGTDGPK